MKRVIDIPDRLYESIKEKNYTSHSEHLAIDEYILHSTPLNDIETDKHHKLSYAEGQVQCVICGEWKIINDDSPYELVVLHICPKCMPALRELIKIRKMVKEIDELP